MAVTKNALLRYRTLDECFSNPYKKFFLTDLVRICSEKLSQYYGYDFSIEKRAIQYDIAFMKSSAGYDAPIETIKEGKSGYYRYSDPTFSITKKELNPSELLSVKDALVMMSRMKGIPGFGWINEMQVQLESALNFKLSSTSIIAFEENEYLNGKDFLNILYNHIIEKNTLDLQYKPFFLDQVQNYTVSPYYLKEYNNRWYLLAWHHANHRIETYPLDRVVSINSLQITYIETDTLFDDYFEDIIGVTNYMDKEVEHIEIELAEDIIPYVQTKPLHGSQKLKNNILTLDAKLNYELESVILSFGENMKVVKPQELKKIIQDRINHSAKNY